MWITFGDYCKQRENLLGEAQSRGDPRIQIDLDDKDRDFIAQAVAKGISDAVALRTRYTLLLHDKPGESGPVRFFNGGRRPFVTVHIDRTHLKHLQDKLLSLGATNAAQHGFSPVGDRGQADTTEFYGVAFSRSNAGDVLRRNKPIDLNYGISGVETAVTISRTPAIATTSGQRSVSTQQSKSTRSAIVKQVPYDWSNSYLSASFSDKRRSAEVGKLLTLDKLPDNKKLHDFTQVWRAVQTLVGDTSKPGNFILPEVWAIFQQYLPEIGQTIFNGVFRQLKQFDPSAADNVLEIKQAMMQTTALLLSNPLRGVKTAKSKDFIRDVDNLLSYEDKVFNLARSYTSQGYLSRVSGIKTYNTRRREIGGEMTAKPYDLDAMSREADLRSDVEVEEELERIDPAVDRIVAKLRLNNWDTGKLTPQEHDLVTQYNDLRQELRRFQLPYRVSGRR